mmetsp:Transcript_11865/g.27382  ORF Transcript_11865/g.27382 Transcript_11865/m.27382 type:complete len:99 (+) Transcript_11865:646-942(+)
MELQENCIKQLRRHFNLGWMGPCCVGSVVKMKYSSRTGYGYAIIAAKVYTSSVRMCRVRMNRGITRLDTILHGSAQNLVARSSTRSQKSFYCHKRAQA